MNLVDAQQAGRVLDRLVGYSISPALWAKIKKGYQPVACNRSLLNLIIQREQEIKAF